MRRLQRGHGSDGLGSAQLVHVEVGNANPAYFAFALQLGEGRPSFFQCGGVRIWRPMDLVEIDHIDSKPAQAVLDFAADGLGAQHLSHVALRVPAQAALGKDIRPRTEPAFEGAGDNFLRESPAVDGSTYRSS